MLMLQNPRVPRNDRKPSLAMIGPAALQVATGGYPHINLTCPLPLNNRKCGFNPRRDLSDRLEPRINTTL